MGDESDGKAIDKPWGGNHLMIEARPDTRPIPVADGWAGTEMRVFTLLDSCSQTDGRTDGRTDGQRLL